MKDKTVKAYSIADRAWQPVVGCDPHMPCAPRCWARKTVARIVKCQEPVSPSRAEFFQIALTPDGKQWSGKTYLDEAHLLDPLKWKKPAIIATGFHGDWGRLQDSDMLAILQQTGKCPQHMFMLLTKQPQNVLAFLANRKWRNIGGRTWPDLWVAVIPGGHAVDDSGALPNVSIGCSVMNQSEANKMLPSMSALSAIGWRAHVWYEPALGPVDWSGWEFIELIIPGGESGTNPRPFNVDWARATIKWAKAAGVLVFMKQLGANVIQGGERRRKKDRKGADMHEWEHDLRIREMPVIGGQA